LSAAPALDSLSALDKSSAQLLHSTLNLTHSNPVSLEYYTSEQFIHDDLCSQAQGGVNRLYQTWKTAKKIDPFLVAWPSTPVKAKDGTPIDGPCLMELSDVNRDEWHPLILEAIQKTSAYAILLAEQKPEAVQVILESEHGARCWTLPIVRSGDAYVLGSAQVTNDKECLGLLWRKVKAQA
jgi:hypothetical protein